MIVPIGPPESRRGVKRAFMSLRHAPMPLPAEVIATRTVEAVVHAGIRTRSFKVVGVAAATTTAT
jgi:hypothetical protein